MDLYTRFQIIRGSLFQLPTFSDYPELGSHTHTHTHTTMCEEPSSSSLSEYIANQEELEREARDLMPYDPNKCTFEMGPLRQPLYACLTCYKSKGTLNAVCYACSIKCHTSHELAELFSKRSFTCDCGTSRVQGPCFVRYPTWLGLLEEEEPASSSISTGKSTPSSDPHTFTPDISDSNNRYGHNFKGLFCTCDTPYNPLTDSNMIQCIFGQACDEDWYHEECLMGLKPGVVNRNANQKLIGQNRLHDLSAIDEKNTQNPKQTEEYSENENGNDNDHENGTTDLLPLPGFPDLDAFETIICWKCASKFPVEMSELENLLHCDTVKYVPALSFDERLSKLRSTNTSKRVKSGAEPQTFFLKHDYKSVFQKHIAANPNTKLSKLLLNYPYLFNDDPIYTPPEDSDDSSSIFELGLKEINSVSSDKIVEGLAVYDKIKSKLTEFLKPFAQEGRIVTENEIKEFFKNDLKK